MTVKHCLFKLQHATTSMYKERKNGQDLTLAVLDGILCEWLFVPSVFFQCHFCDNAMIILEQNLTSAMWYISDMQICLNTLCIVQRDGGEFEVAPICHQQSMLFSRL